VDRCRQQSPRPKRPPQLGTWGLDLAGMDERIKPGDDFYSFVSGERELS